MLINRDGYIRYPDFEYKYMRHLAIETVPTEIHSLGELLETFLKPRDIFISPGLFMDAVNTQKPNIEKLFNIAGEVSFAPPKSLKIILDDMQLTFSLTEDFNLCLTISWQKPCYQLNSILNWCDCEWHMAIDFF